MSTESEKSSVKVAVRIRPLNNRESNTDLITTCKDTTLYIKNPEDNKEKTFMYDYLYDTDTTQTHVFNNIGSKVIDHAFKGYNACIFAYGQTGCFAKGTPITMWHDTDEIYKNVEDIQVGDVLMGDDGKPRNVLRLYRGRQQMYRISPLDYRHISNYVVNEDHIMVILTKDDKIIDVPLKDLDINKFHCGLYHELSGYLPQRLYVPYLFTIEKLDIDDYYGFELDGNQRFLHKDGIILHNSGKSHTMMGSGSDLGLIPKICDALFSKQYEYSSQHPSIRTTYKVELSYLEIYSEEVRDLLSKNSNTGLKVRQHPELGPYVEGLSQILVEEPRMARKLIDQGNKERVTAATLMNSRSSRSHAILTLYFTQIMNDSSLGKSREIVSKINLVDLAGSEKVDASGVTGINFKEAININKSLSTLGLVIGKLALLSTNKKTTNSTTSNNSTNLNNNTLNSTTSNIMISKNTMIKNTTDKSFKNSSTKTTPRYKYSPTLKLTNNKSPKLSPTETSIVEHVPFRDSVLTWILKESLGGNSKTYMIATISPSAINYNESLSTLRYAKNAKQIVNSVKVNEDSNDKLIRILTDEVETLKKQLLLKGSDNSTSSEELRFLKEELKQREILLKEKDKTWEQKLEESKRMNNEAQEQLKQEFANKQNEYKRKLEMMDDERSKLLQEMETLKSSMYDNAISQKAFEEELAKKQAEFEKGRIIDTAVSLQEYYEQKLQKLKQDYEEKMNEKRDTENKQMLFDIQELRSVNLQLKEDLSKSQNVLQMQVKQFTNERTVLSRQIQQLHTKIHSLEQELIQRKVVSPTKTIDNLSNNLAQTNSGLKLECELLIARINANKEELNRLEDKRRSILQSIDISKSELELIKKEYATLMIKFKSDKSEYDTLLAQKEILHNEIIKLRHELELQIVAASDKLKTPTIENLLQIRDGFDKIFSNLSKL